MSYTIAQHASKYGIIPLKKYSQNFIFDSTLCDKIVRVSGINKGDLVLEIGPGTAGLTKSILKNSPRNLTVIEMDTRCIPLLEDIKIDFPSLNIINADALDYDLSLLNSNEINIISNLPYQIGTELVIRWLKKAKLISSITVMLQKEVVERIRAQVSTKAYGRLSVICQLICDIEKGFDVSPEAFYPRPKIHSAIVKLIPRQVQVDEVLFEKIELVTKLAFGQRRKMLKSSLKGVHKNIENILLELGINSTVRAENLTSQDFLSIAQRL